MITSLSIQGLAIIDSLSIEFGPGFNVITGETGAGKSILIRALNLLLGGKSSPDAIRKGNDHATVSAVFQVPVDHEAPAVLTHLGIPFETEGKRVEIVIRRLLSVKGKSQSWINDVAVTGNALKELGVTLVDIFGQHENQRLLNPQKHLQYIDEFVKEKESKAELSKIFTECSELVSSIQEVVAAFLQNSRNQDYLSYRFEEIKKFDPSEEDYQKVQALCESTDKQVAVRDSLAKVLTYLEGNEDQSISQSLKEAAKYLQQVPPAFADDGIRERLHALVVEVEDINYEISTQLEKFNVDESELEAAQSRHFGYQDLFRKFGVREISSLVEEATKLQTDLDALESAATKIEQSLILLQKSAKQLQIAAEKLTAVRRKALSHIRKSVEQELADLAMVGAKFDAEWKPVVRHLPEIDLSGFEPKLQKTWQEVQEILSHVNEHGSETAEFLLASNRGEANLPLVRVASGGELSRIMLALKKALAADAETCVLVFDEIDVGISGRVADVVGKKMRGLSESFQVLCISHLPQVAVYADRHFLVEKAGKGERTETQIVGLSEEESAAEIARLLSGAKVSESSLANAKHLIRLAHGGARQGTLQDVVKTAANKKKSKSPESRR